MRLDRNPNEMTMEERVLELREIFSHGVVRAVLISGTRGAAKGHQALTGSARPSDECVPQRIGVNQSN